jgi:hypothetical protein
VTGKGVPAKAKKIGRPSLERCTNWVAGLTAGDARFKLPRIIWHYLADGGGCKGAVAEWLRSGLQSRVHRFESGPRLHG